MKKLLAIGVILITLFGIYTWFFVYNKKHKDIESAKVDFTISSEQLISEFEAQKDTAQKKYNEKVLDISGRVLEILGDDSLSSIVLQGNTNYTIICEVLNKYNDDVSSLKKDDAIHVKGLYVGFMEADSDMGLPGDIRLKKCFFKK